MTWYIIGGVLLLLIVLIVLSNMRKGAGDALRRTEKQEQAARSREAAGQAFEEIKDLLGEGPVNPNNPNWILIKRGTPDSIHEALKMFFDIHGGQSEDWPAIRITVSRHKDGFFALQVNSQIWSYTFVNLTGWMNQPSEIEDVSVAVGWFNSPGDGTRYVLYNEHDNPLGDSLLGVSDAGLPVRVYLPEASLCETSGKTVSLREPELNPSDLELLFEFEAPDYSEEGFGNPDFAITHPKDHRGY